MKYNLKILIGPNGSGKTSYINKIWNNYENTYKKKGFVKLRLDNESLDNLHKGINSLFNKKLKEFNKEIESKTNINDINKEAENLIEKNKFKDKIENIDNFELDINKYFKNLNTQIKMKPDLKVSKKIIENKWILKIDKEEVEIESAPSGVKKLILFYFQIIEEFHKPGNENKKKPRLLILEEIENFLHPSWINICITLIRNIISNIEENDQILISTHNPEVIVLLKDYIEYFSTPENYGNDVREINLKKAHDIYEEINQNIKGHKKKNLNEYKTIIKTRLSFELGRFMFSKNSPVILCEGITDQMFISKNTDLLVTNSFGYYNFGLYISLHMGLYGEKNKFLKIIADGDGKLCDDSSNQKKLKKKLEEMFDKEKIFYFKNNIEQDLYKHKKNHQVHKKNLNY